MQLAMQERNGWIRFRSRLHLLSAQPGLLHSSSPQTLSFSGHLGMHTVDLFFINKPQFVGE